MKRCGYRNGYKPRKLKRGVGTLELLFPRIREGRFQLQLFARYQRSEKALVSSLMRCTLRDFKVKGCYLRLIEGYFNVKVKL